MKSHKYIAGGLTFLVSVALATSSFAAKKAMNDSDMDQATAKGQSAVSIGTGNQTIKDQSEASLSFKDTVIKDKTWKNLADYQSVEGGVLQTFPDTEVQALDNVQVEDTDATDAQVNSVQEHAVAGNLINVAGENNIAATVNAASSSGGALDTIEQNNNIDQSKAAFIDKSKLDISESSFASTETKSKTESCEVAKNTSRSSTENCTLNATLSCNSSQSKTWTETFPVADITINLNSDSTSTANGGAGATGDASATGTSTADAASTATENTTKNVSIDVNKNINIDKTIPEAPAGLASFSGQEGGEGRSRGSSLGVSVDVDKDETINVTKNTTTLVDAEGPAAVADANADSHEQAYGSAAATGTAKAESDAKAKLDLPTANSGSCQSSSSSSATLSTSKNSVETCTDNSTYKSSSTCESSKETTIVCKKDQSQLDIVQADHVKIGDGDQRICLETEYDITMEGNAQGSAKALNIINAVGRNNVAVAWNLASSAGGTIDVSAFVSGGTPTVPGTIHQVNVVKQVN